MLYTKTFLFFIQKLIIWVANIWLDQIGVLLLNFEQDEKIVNHGDRSGAKDGHARLHLSSL